MGAGACELLATNLCQNPVWSSDEDLQQSAIWCISNLCVNAKIAKRFVEGGAGQGIVLTCRRTLEGQADDIVAGPVCEASVFALRNLILASRAVEQPTKDNNEKVAQEEEGGGEERMMATAASAL